MLVPVMTSCGHNYCYDCISNWLNNNNATELTCPQCRTNVSIPPVLNVSLQQLVNTLIDTLDKDKDDTVALYLARDESVKQYKSDFSKNVLYNNVFGNTAIAVVDDDDGVARCSNCHWEVEGAVCPHCNARMRNRIGNGENEGFQSDEYSEGELESLENDVTTYRQESARQLHDLEAEDDEEEESLSDEMDRRFSVPRNPRNFLQENSSDGEKNANEYSEEDSDLNTFIVNDYDSEIDDASNDSRDESSSNDKTKVSRSARTEFRDSQIEDESNESDRDSDFYEHNDDGGFVSGDSLDDASIEEKPSSESEDESGRPSRKRRFQVVLDSDEE